jgi:putative transposase
MSGGIMTKRKKHSKDEIAAKLAQASAMARQGRLQNEIASMLGVSVMTLHRWRKTSAKGDAPSLAPEQVAFFEKELARAPQGGSQQGGSQQIADLQLENSRLRRLVTDLLLEKMQLIEDMQGQSSPSDGMNLAR